MNRSEMIEYVKRQLGYPTVNVELTENQINDSIDKAINEIKPWYTIFRYLTLDLTSHCVDLSEYDVSEVTDVIKVFDTKSANNATVSDPFAYSGMSVYYANPMYAISNYSTSITARQGIHKIISSYAQMYQEQFYARLAMMMQERVAGTLNENISWKYYDNKLYVDTCVPSTSIITIEYIPNVADVEDFSASDRYMNYLKDLSVAFSLLVQARVTGKYQVSGSPTSINYHDMRNDAQRDIDRIRDDLRKTANTFFITD